MKPLQITRISGMSASSPVHWRSAISRHRSPQGWQDSPRCEVSLDKWLLPEVGETTRQPLRWCTVIRSGQLEFILIPMEDSPDGLTDKFYWRKAKGEWHCFQKLAVRGFISLCRHREINFVHGQQIARPEVRLRCGFCDELEMVRRGWCASGPASPRRAGSFSR
jgi:hypothetical protein